MYTAPMKAEKKRSILLLCDYRAPYGGNFIASLRRLDPALKAAGANRRYLFPAEATARAWFVRFQAETLAADGFADGLPFFRRLGRLLGEIDAAGADTLHVHFGFFPLAECAALLRPRLRLILHFHSDFSAGRKPSFPQRVKRLGTRLVRALLGKRLVKITVSESSAVGERGCLSLPNALVTERFTDETWDRARTRAAYGLGESERLAVVFGWSPEVKGVDVAVRAVRRLRRDGRAPWKLGVVCGRTFTEERMRAWIEAHVGKGEGEDVLFLPPTEDVFRYHLAADAFVSASRSETFSYALLEAISAGRPCVASDIPGVQWARAFDTVRFVPAGDDAALSDALVALDYDAAAPGYAARLMAAAQRATDMYAIDRWVDGLLTIYGLHKGTARPGGTAAEGVNKGDMAHG